MLVSEIGTRKWHIPRERAKASFASTVQLAMTDQMSDDGIAMAAAAVKAKGGRCSRSSE